MSVVIHLDLNFSRAVVLCAKRTGIFRTVYRCVSVYVLYMYILCIPPKGGGREVDHLRQSAEVKNEWSWTSAAL
jgi:hypothetical protein